MEQSNLIIGIDDAGRGPIIGPMVLAGILIQEKHHQFLKELGVKDSKLLLPEKRKSIALILHEKFPFHIEVATPEEIDSRTAVGTNLNWIEAIKSANIINTLAGKIKEKIKVIIDCPSPNIAEWTLYLRKHILNPEKIELSCEHKADLNHLSVSAASIIAKTHRDKEIEKLKQQLGINFGSGYCSDPLTQKFLEGDLKEFESLGIIRKSWDTWSKVQAKKEQKKLF